MIFVMDCKTDVHFRRTLISPKFELTAAQLATKRSVSIMAPLLVGIVALETIMALILAATKGGHRLL